MTDQPSDPIAAAVEGVCDNWELLPVEDDTVEEEWQDCIHCKHPQWRHWLRALREQLAETERARDEAYQTVSEWKQSGHRIAEDRDAARKELREALGTIDAAMAVPLQANTRLREALEWIHEVADGQPKDLDMPISTVIMIAEKAAAALARTHPKGTSDG